MIIKEISSTIFDDFSKNHILKNQYQTSNYAEVKKIIGYDVMYIGAYKNNELIAVSLILYKLIIPTVKYGYAPRGFIIDYYNQEEFKEFTKALKSFFLLKNFAFIKIDPELIYSIVNPVTQTKEINTTNEKLINYMISIGYEKLKDTLYFDSMMPKYNPIINLNDFKLSNLDKEVIEKIKKSKDLGLVIKIGTKKDIKEFYNLIKEKKDRQLPYYEKYYDSFIKDNLIDLLLLEIDFNVYQKFLQKEYEKEENINIDLNEQFLESNKNLDLFNKKMESDKKLNNIKSEIINITQFINRENKIKYIIAGALVTKLDNRVNVIINGHDKQYKFLNSKLYLFYNIILYYKENNYEYLDMDGITIDFTNDNPYKSLNEFKLMFKPTIYEYIGEFDLIINPAYYQMLWNTGKLKKEFQKERISN